MKLDTTLVEGRTALPWLNPTLSSWERTFLHLTQSRNGRTYPNVASFRQMSIAPLPINLRPIRSH
jgi:hypothetical protein